MPKVRTNIEIEGTYVRTIMDRYGVHTKTEAVDLALRDLAGQAMTREEALAIRGAGAAGAIRAALTDFVAAARTYRQSHKAGITPRGMVDWHDRHGDVDGFRLDDASR